ncbi:MAG: hypothetical protein ABI395_00605 [Sphingobium sp.]
MSINSATGQQELTGGDAMPWAIDTLTLGGDIRAKYIRLQDYVRALLGGEPVPTKPVTH